MIKNENNTLSTVYDTETLIGKIYKGIVKLYESWRKLLASGIPPLTLLKCKQANLVDYKVYGESVQGENVIDYKSFVSLSGNSTYYYIDNIGNLVQKTKDYRPDTQLSVILILQPGEYVFLSSAKNSRFYLDNVVTTSSYFTIDKETEFKFKSWEDADTIINPVLKKAPTPDTPIEIESVGEKTNNLFDIDVIETTNKITQNGDGTITSYAYPCATGKTLSQVCPELKVGDNIIVTLETEGYKGVYLSGSGVLLQVNNSYTITQEHLDSKVMFYGGRNGEGITISKIQFQIDETKEYEPYGYRIPIKTRGKNFFDISKVLSSTNGKIINNDNKSISIYGNAFSGEAPYTLKDYCPELEVGKTYIFSAKHDIETETYRRIYLLETAVSWRFDTISNLRTLTITQEHLDSKVLWYKDADKEYNTVWDIQVEEMVNGDTATDYEPYVESTTTNIYLKEPLRKIGEYADYIDFINKKVIRKIYKSIPYLKNWNSGSSYSNGLCRYQCQLTPIPNYNVAPISNGIKGNAGNIIAEANNITFNPTYNYLYMYFNCSDVGIEVPDATISNTENGTAIKNYIDEKGIYILYVLEQEREETIELPTLATNKGTNIIEVDTTIIPSNMEVTYLGKK